MENEEPIRQAAVVTPLTPLEASLGYRFANRDLLQQALIHPSARYEMNLSDDNQRMEYLGDAALGLITAEFVYHQHGASDEGTLTILRSAVTNTAALAGLARRLELGRYMRLGKGEEASGGRDKERNLADALEAIIGAAYLDGGIASVRAMFEQVFVPAFYVITSSAVGENPKGQLQEWAQRHGLSNPAYKVVSEAGPPHQKHYVVEVRLDEERKGEGAGNSKRNAEVQAARSLWAKINLPPEDSSL